MSRIDAIEPFDMLVLGSGEAGKYLAWTIGSQGKHVALVERRYVGGSCPNIACLPSKNLVHSAKVAWYAQRLSEFGLKPAASGVNMAAVIERKRKMVADLVDLNRSRFAASHTEFIDGEGSFVAPRTISVESIDGNKRNLTAEVVIVSTGSQAIIPAIPGLLESAPMTHVEELELEVLPEHLVVLGGGYVGLEFAQAMRRFGSAVTVVDQSKRLLPHEDEDTVGALMEILEAEGIQFHLDTAVQGVRGRSGEAVDVRIEGATGEQILHGTHILVATGRSPNTRGIGLENAGIELNETGHVKVDASLRTTAPDVYAVGDCAGSPHFTHIAYDDFRIVREQLSGGRRSTAGRQVPYTLFTDPELAHVGLHEHQAIRRGIRYRVAKLPMSAVLRTRTLGQTGGFLKALVAENDQILGFTALGVDAGEMLAPVQLAMSAGLPYTALRDLIVTHPTMTEGLVYLFSSIPRR